MANKFWDVLNDYSISECEKVPTDLVECHKISTSTGVVEIYNKYDELVYLEADEDDIETIVHLEIIETSGEEYAY